MKHTFIIKVLILFYLFKIDIVSLYGQEINLGFEDSIDSKILNENRKLLVRLPIDYNNSQKSYPVIYRLDGNLDLFIETVGVIHRLAYMEKVIPDMIVVMIENINRNRDMMPTATKYFKSEIGAGNFKNFIQNELVPHIENTYRTTNNKVLCGQSLSAIFTLYYFLSSPETFNSYIVCSGGFLDCENYFLELTNEMLKKKLENSRKIFLTHGLTDFLDPEGVTNKQLSNFNEMLQSNDSIISKYKVYQDDGHVPYQSLYHGLKFVYTNPR